MKVKLIIATTMSDTVYFNYGDDYSDISRVFVEDHSPFEEVHGQEFEDLKAFVEQYNIFNRKKGQNSFAFIVEAMPTISAQSAIKQIREKREKDAEEWKRKMEEKVAEQKKRAEEAKAKKELNTIEKKRKQLEKLKKELGE